MGFSGYGQFLAPVYFIVNLTYYVLDRKKFLKFSIILFIFNLIMALINYRINENITIVHSLSILTIFYYSMIKPLISKEMCGCYSDKYIEAIKVLTIPITGVVLLLIILGNKYAISVLGHGSIYNYSYLIILWSGFLLWEIVLIKKTSL